MNGLWSSAELREATQGRLDAELSVSGISIDTRSLEPGDLFIALVGENSDGHAHIATALDKGAACVMVHQAHAALTRACCMWPIPWPVCRPSVMRHAHDFQAGWSG